MTTYFLFIFLFNFLIFFCFAAVPTNNEYKKEHFVYWPNATIPFYINLEHFDKEQSLAIMSSLALFEFKTCIQFKPLLVEPRPNQHVMLFENPRGIRKCHIGMEGHAKEEPHRIILGYDCLKSPQIDMLIMKALGFPFEHNRASRNIFIDVQFENIESSSIPLYTKDNKLPVELRPLPYDVNSVMHFGERDFSKNGHRTILFKDPNTKQSRIGLSKIDLRKIEIIYGDECKKRERLAKIDICKSYPSSRMKRDIDLNRSLRINPEITPPPEKNLTDEVSNSLTDLGVDKEVEDLVEEVHKITAKALENARVKQCEKKENITIETYSNHDIADIIEATTNYVRSVVTNALVNITAFCDDKNAIDLFQRARCGYGTGNRCPMYYKSTKSGRVKYSTQHRPIIIQSTKHDGKGRKPQYVSWFRSGNNTEVRRKRDLTDVTDDINYNNTDNKNVANLTVDAIDASKDSLRFGTTISIQKVVNFAPVRRFRGHGDRSKETPDDESTMSESSKIIIKKKREHPKTSNSDIMKPKKHKKKPKENREEEKENREEEKEINAEEELAEDRPKHKKSKKRKERQRITHNVPETVKLTKANKEFYAERIWPDGVVRYFITEYSNYDIRNIRSRIAEVNDILKSKTCVRLEEISEKEIEKHNDYIVLDTSADYITGRVGGKQNFGCIELFEGGQHRQHTAMMIMAMLGFYFEISRHDRDNYIRVHMRHIRADKLHHFEKIRSDATLAIPYDYKSATHPAWQFWRKVGKTGISTVATYKDRDRDGSVMKSLGQNTELLSDGDILKINSVYGVRCFKNQNQKQERR